MLHLYLAHLYSFTQNDPRFSVRPPTAAFLTQTVCLDDTTVKFEIWDTAGQERYHSLAPMYYRGAQAAIVVYDITNEVSPGPERSMDDGYYSSHTRGSLLNLCVLGSAGVVCAGEELGQRAPETSQPQHRNSSGREQGGSGQQKSAGLPGRVS